MLLLLTSVGTGVVLDVDGPSSGAVSGVLQSQRRLSEGPKRVFDGHSRQGGRGLRASVRHYCDTKL